MGRSCSSLFFIFFRWRCFKTTYSFLTFFLTSTPCLSSSLLPSSFIIICLLTPDKVFLSKAHYRHSIISRQNPLFLVFHCIGEYISLDLFHFESGTFKSCDFQKQVHRCNNGMNKCRDWPCNVVGKASEGDIIEAQVGQVPQLRKSIRQPAHYHVLYVNCRHMSKCRHRSWYCQTFGWPSVVGTSPMRQWECWGNGNTNGVSVGVTGTVWVLG